MLENEKKISGSILAQKLYEEFKKAVLIICSDLKIDQNGVEVRRLETAKLGLDFIASSDGEPFHFYFQIRTVTNEDEVTEGRMMGYLDIYSTEGFAPFDFDEDITNKKSEPDFIQRWTSKIISEYKNEIASGNISSIFDHSDLRVYGMPESPYPTIHELTIFLNGVVSYIDKLIVYRFKHIKKHDTYRQFSYAFLIPSGRPLWIIFLKAGSPDSGGAKHDLDYIEDQIHQVGKKIKVERKERDIEYDQLERYIVQHGSSFEKDLSPIIYEHSIFENLELSKEVFGKELYDEYKKMKKHYESEDYKTALRELRPIVQEALLTMCSKNNVDISDLSNQNVSNLISRLIGAGLIDSSHQKWVEAFAQEPNRSMHRVYPTEKDLEQSGVEDRIKLSFQYAVNLLSLLTDLNRNHELG